MKALFTNDAITFGVLMLILTFVFVTSSSSHPFWKKFYQFIPSILLCYLLPSFLNYPLGWVNGETSNLYFVASRYLLPTAMILLCLSIDLKGVYNLGGKAVIMYLAATFGVILGGPVALFIVIKFMPDILNTDTKELWRGLSTVAGSWIGGSANQTAMKEIQQVSDKLFGAMIVIDIITANIWMACILYGVSVTKKIDNYLGADTSAIEALKKQVQNYQSSILKIPTTQDTMLVLGIGFIGTGIAHLGADLITPWMNQHIKFLNDLKLNSFTSHFFWLVIIATTIGVGLSFTKYRKMDGIGSSRFGSIFIYILVATIGMKMNVGELFDNLGLFAIGIIWMLVHIIILLAVAKLIRAPFFFVAVGSQANIGGAASAPIVASAFSPALASVGILMAVVGYASGTYGAIICTKLMEWISF